MLPENVKPVFKPRGLSKTERLCSKKVIESVVKSTTECVFFPLKCKYLIQPQENFEDFKVVFFISVSKRNFKRAVDRNRIKRLIREAYRLNKQQLITTTQEKPCTLFLMFRFIGKDLPQFDIIELKIKATFKRLIKAINEYEAV